MISIKPLPFLLLIAACVLSASPASADPAWCYRYTATDAFNNASAWSQWDNAVGGIIEIGPNADARSPSKAATFLFDSGTEAPGAFLLIDRLFTPTQNLTESYRKAGCATPIPTPSGVPVSCEARLWVRPFQGISGALQLIDNSTWYYLASVPITLGTSSAWQLVTLTSTSCSADMVVRIVANKSWSSTGMDVDDLSLIRYY